LRQRRAVLEAFVDHAGISDRLALSPTTLEGGDCGAMAR
jgi:hypothetical protein